MRFLLRLCAHTHPNMHIHITFIIMIFKFIVFVCNHSHSNLFRSGFEYLYFLCICTFSRFIQSEIVPKYNLLIYCIQTLIQIYMWTYTQEQVSKWKLEADGWFFIAFYFNDLSLSKNIFLFFVFGKLPKIACYKFAFIRKV